MDKLSRRAALCLVPAGVSSLAIPFAAAHPTNGVACAAPERPVERLMLELSDTLVDYCEGKWFAQVHPARDDMACSRLFKTSTYNCDMTAMRIAWEAERKLAAAPAERRLAYHRDQLLLALGETRPGEWSCVVEANDVMVFWRPRT